MAIGGCPAGTFVVYKKAHNFLNGNLYERIQMLQNQIINSQQRVEEVLKHSQKQNDEILQNIAEFRQFHIQQLDAIGDLNTNLANFQILAIHKLDAIQGLVGSTFFGWGAKAPPQAKNPVTPPQMASQTTK